jgi:hypothetical protein
VFRLVVEGWEAEVLGARRANPRGLSVVCPFIKEGAMRRILDAGRNGPVEIVTRFDLGGFYDGVSDVSALRLLLGSGARVRGVRRLHAKLFLFGSDMAIGTSANVTDAAMLRNHEFGFVSDDPGVVGSCRDYFDGLWSRAGDDLRPDRLDAWDAELAVARRDGGGGRRPRLRDYGVEAGAATPFAQGSVAPPAGNAFLKFFGRGGDRTPRDVRVAELVADSGCNWACTYPTSVRPRQVADGDTIYMARIAAPDDLLIFGTAIGWRHRDGEDVASAVEIAARPWKVNWANYVRVHGGRFVNAELGVGVSMYEMMDALGADSFRSTSDNARSGWGNTDPRLSYLRKPGMQLTDRSRAWIDARLEELFRLHGEVDLTPRRFRPPR